MSSRPAARKTVFAILTLMGSLTVCAVLLEVAIRVFDIGPEINAVWRGNFRLSKNPAIRYELQPGYQDAYSKISKLSKHQKSTF